jgi:hypothetical protein
MSRRQLLRHTAWFGAAVVLTVTGGEVISHLGNPPAAATAAAQDPHALRFVQISDSHLGFHGPANTDVTGSFSRAIDQVNTLGFRPDFVMHTGDLTHLSTPAQFDQVGQMLRGLRTGGVFTVPGEHDSVDDHGQKYRAMFGAGNHGDGWYSFRRRAGHPRRHLPTRSTRPGDPRPATHRTEAHMNPAVALGARLAAAGCLVTSGVIHAELYLHGYRTIPGVGPAFLLQASGALAVAVRIRPATGSTSPDQRARRNRHPGSGRHPTRAPHPALSHSFPPVVKEVTSRDERRLVSSVPPISLRRDSDR